MCITSDYNICLYFSTIRSWSATAQLTLLFTSYGSIFYYRCMAFYIEGYLLVHKNSLDLFALNSSALVYTEVVYAEQSS
jgi:hypothetical protein